MKEINYIVKEYGEREDTKVASIFDLVKLCIIRVIDKGEDIIYETQDFTSDDLDRFLDSLNNEQFGKIEDFFNQMPKLSHEITVTNPNTKKKNKIILEGLQDFLD